MDNRLSKTVGVLAIPSMMASAPEAESGCSRSPSR